MLVSVNNIKVVYIITELILQDTQVSTPSLLKFSCVLSQTWTSSWPVYPPAVQLVPAAARQPWLCRGKPKSGVSWLLPGRGCVSYSWTPCSRIGSSSWRRWSESGGRQEGDSRVRIDWEMLLSVRSGSWRGRGLEERVPWLSACLLELDVSGWPGRVRRRERRCSWWGELECSLGEEEECCKQTAL